jgi:hypothetical protein
MADSTTPIYSLIQPEIDGADGTWGVSTNSNWLSVDNLLSGVSPLTTINVTNLKISADQGTVGQVLTSTGSGIEWGTGSAPTLAETLALGNDTGSNDINVTGTQKITFGAGNDLQIYHTGTASLISETGTGDLFIRSSNALRLQSAENENYLVANANGSLNLYYDNATKLATTNTGIDVTGGVQADYIDLTGGESTNTTGTIACAQIIFDDLSTLGTDSASISTEANGTTSTLRIKQADDANSDRILLQAGAEDVLIADSTGVQSSIMIEDRSTAIIDQDLIPYFGKRMINTATAATTYAIPQVSTVRRGKTVVICNPTNRTITLDADGGTGTIAQYVWILDGVTLFARNGDWQIKAGGVVELVQINSQLDGGSQSAPNYVIFGAGILAI